MGTLGDWGTILLIAVFVGLYGWMRDMGHKPYVNKLGRSLAGWILFSIALCIWFNFHRQALTVPFVFITLPVGVAGVILIYFARPRGRQQASEELPATEHK